MTATTWPTGAEPTHRTDLPRRITTWAGLLAGAALVVDTVTITIVNASFGVLDDALFLVGFAGLWVTTLALAVALSAGRPGRAGQGRRGLARIGAGVAWFVGVGVVLGGLSGLADAIGRHVFSPANVGLHGEWSFLTIGLCLLGIAAWAHRSQRPAE